jgi:GT2 family glycosyltransferase
MHLIPGLIDRLFKQITKAHGSEILQSWERWLLSQSKFFYYLNELRIKWDVFDNNRRYSNWLRKQSIVNAESIIPFNDPGLSSAVVSIFLLAGKDNFSRLELTLSSISQQRGSKWKLFIIYPHDLKIGPIINETNIPKNLYPYQDNISQIETLNRIIEQDTGDFVTFITSGDILAPNALSEVIHFFNQDKQVDVVYTDEDQIDRRGKRGSPLFKPGWSPDLFLSYPYLGHLTVYRKESIRRMVEFHQYPILVSEYDLLLRIVLDAKQVAHLPMLLYSRYSINPTFHPAQQGALKSAIHHEESSATVEFVPDSPGYSRIHWPLKNSPLISILICTRDKADYLHKCLSSIFEKSIYPNYEVVLIDNGSREERTKALFATWQAKEPSRIHFYSVDTPFNFSGLNNLAVTHAKGELVLFLNNDIEVISPNWLEEMGAQAQRPSIGAVSAMLLYPNKTVQHAGIIVGGPSMAVHGHHRFPVHSPGYMGRLLVASNYSAVTAACMMIRKDTFLTHGGFDENLAISYGDVEFCLRLRQVGYYHVVLPYIQLYHHESITRGYEDTEEKLARMNAEKNYVLNRWPELFRQDNFYHSSLQETGNFMIKA